VTRSTPEHPERPDDRVDRIVAAWARERPDLDTTPPAVIGRLHLIGRLLTAQLVAEYERWGLSEGEFDVLATLRRAGAPYARTAGELASHTMITTGGLTKRVDRLVERGLVRRDVDAGDARQRTISLTAAGRALIDDAYTAHIANEQRLLASLPAEDRAALERILAGWLASLERAP